MKPKYMVGGVIIVAFIIWGVSSFMSFSIQYVSLNEVPQTTGVVQVMGKIDFDSVTYDAAHSQLIFDITGLEKKTMHDRLKVVFSGAVPGNFEQATSVVAKGRYKDGTFVADQLFVKCPSKYQGLEKQALEQGGV
ncbi:MAG: cytochrome c maturation protein CcmE [candidate division Zixibacteria bacterium]|nr:cytochrome c maturation protein CcmE [candidate division Zixibacteria bacterium]